MLPFVRLDAIAVPLPQGNINTDLIIPARFLRKQRAEGFGQFLFNDLRFDEAGQEIAAFPLNHAPFRAAQMIVAGPNFGCGSSREMAVWALSDYGIRAIVAPSFGDIFFNNCVRNGLLCVVLDAHIVEDLLALLERAPGTTLTVDLAEQTVHSPTPASYPFAVDPFNKKCLLQGIDGVDYTLQFADQIAAFEARYEAAQE
jgi:3-isopropylmalate/(R)-2-methylmalate dehydratase small subunit